MLFRSGARHLANPSRLILGAKAVYGEKFNELFDPILPVPEDRIFIKNDGDSLELGEESTLLFIDTPGHANHHFSIYHPSSKGIFSGDTAGIFYPQIYQKGIEFYLPSTSPNQFDPGKMLKSIERFKELELERIYFGHYGMSENPTETFRQVENWLDIFIEEAKIVVYGDEETSEKVELITERLYDKITAHLVQQGFADPHPIYALLQLDINVSAMGLVDYLTKNSGGTR